MKEASPPKAPRDLLNLIVRVPASIRDQIAKEAEDKKISQNQLINGYLFTIMFVLRLEDEYGPPDHTLRLFEAIEAGLKHPDGLVFGALHKNDWEAVRGDLKQFEDALLITPVLTRSDPSADTTVAYTFHITRFGRPQLPLLINMLKMRLGVAGDQSNESNQDSAGVAQSDRALVS